MKKNWLACALMVLVAGSPQADACLWDSDTIAMEVARFPGLAEVMTGQFPRHSREFYEWRRKTLEAFLAESPEQISFYDDLAVAQHKLGDHQAAIATMMKKEKRRPGLYETYSNLGTFYIYTGELNEAVTWIHKALQINPNAHFGREKYQKWLVQWLLERKDKGDPDEDGRNVLRRTRGFARFIALQLANPSIRRDPNEEIHLTDRQRDEAITGVLGMMRFADFDNPVLQEAMGDLLGATLTPEKKASRLAGLAYRHAAQKLPAEGDQKRLKTKMDTATIGARESQETYDSLLANGLAKGRAFAEQVRTDELAWLASGQDASAEFKSKYLR